MCLIFLICSANHAGAQVSVERNLNLELVERDNATALKLEKSLESFLTEAQNNAYSDNHVEPSHLVEFEFFFNKLSGVGNDSNKFHQPLILKSYPVENGSYRITIAFTGTKSGKPFVYQVTELLATPYRDHFRFFCTFKENTAHFKSKKFDNVTYYYSRSINEKRSSEFAGFTQELAKQTKGPVPEIDYYCFRNLDELLKSYGFLYSARQCNFLQYDLGFTDNQGKTFVTGTGNENYVFGYVPEYLSNNLPGQNDIYPPFSQGIAAFYGGYGLSHDDLGELKRQFREKLKEVPETDFLEEFKNGRGSSINRHFSHYVMSAFLFEEALKTKGLEEAFKLLYSGSQGERFFQNLEGVLGINESSFHATILRLID